MNKRPIVYPPKRDSRIINNIIPFNSKKQITWYVLTVLSVSISVYLYSIFNNDNFDTVDYFLIFASGAIGGSGVYYQLLPRIIRVIADQLTIERIERVIDNYCKSNGYKATRSSNRTYYRVNKSIFSFEENQVMYESDHQSLTIRAPSMIASILHEKILAETADATSNR